MKTKLFVGVIFILLGASIFCTQLGIMNLKDVYSFLWPLILIAAGVQRLYKNNTFRTSSAIVILLGVLFELDAFNLLPYNAAALIAPCILIIIGISKIFSANKVMHN
ncbi:LiaF transmembrane domain-containing protein [Clostridium felsineum]|uniref:LiaF transmembrane domain-containing protein n=1 Tax=Clostridium felsineum TaxID=36839 RepID=A0A1S8M793_9CLOT|nr:DUF5668 domain-containing protein [Clostridium felsineum]MCR3760546.1 hypothetical protein [Clostridium felsineum]URZ02115.1 hypothetical protein CLAUR_021120 [Clostridium felsineum]URZ05115.1 hypothetical protein CLROS_004390 [Clostridium felsineum]URZ10156.1 hypothetical protein CROST_008640 [Clostridium felsineum]